MYQQVQNQISQLNESIYMLLSVEIELIYEKELKKIVNEMQELSQQTESIFIFYLVFLYCIVLNNNMEVFLQ